MHGVLLKIWVLLLLSTLVRVSTAEAEQISVEPAERLSSEELQALVAPVALYPDDLIAIVLPASTYPLQIVAASRYREAAAEVDQSDQHSEPDEEWDESIVALLNYPEALAVLNEDLDWTWRLGEAVILQQEDVLAAISEFRRIATEAGNLSSDEYQEVVTENEHVTIRSRDPEVIYVPYYDPETVTVHQIKRVYHYYPDPYPVYYYPYAYGHRFYDRHLFWGINSFFLLSWSNSHLYHHHHNHYRHPYYQRSYHHRHFRHTHRYHAPRAHERRARRHHRERHRDHRDEHRPRRDPVMPWRPHQRYAGVRPHQRHRDLRREGSNTEYRRRAERLNEPGQLRAGLRNQRPRVTTSPPRQQSSVHRDPASEIRHRPQRSSVHRQTQIQRPTERRAQTATRRSQSRATRNDANRNGRANRNDLNRNGRANRNQRANHNDRQRPVMNSAQRPRENRQLRVDPQSRMNRQSHPARQTRAQRQPRATRQPRVSRQQHRAQPHRTPQPRQRARSRPELRPQERAQALR